MTDSLEYLGTLIDEKLIFRGHVDFYLQESQSLTVFN